MNEAHWIVVKFGGTSLATASAWQQVLNIARQHLELSSIQLTPERAIVLIDSALEMPEPEKLTAAISKLIPMLSTVSSEPASSVSLIGHNPEQETALCTELQRLAFAPGHGNTRHELTVIVSREPAGPLVAALHQQLLAS